jgi:hypothetical protein
LEEIDFNFCHRYLDDDSFKKYDIREIIQGHEGYRLLEQYDYCMSGIPRPRPLNLEQIKKLEKYQDWNLFEKFAEKCGKKLRLISIGGINDKQLKSIFRFTPNLKTLVFDVDIKTLIQTNLPNLQEIRNLKLSGDDDFQSFADIYCKQIKKLHLIRFPFLYLNRLLKNLWRFENLEDLKIHISFYKQEIYNEFQLMANKIKKLKRLQVYTVDDLKINEFFEIIGSFKSLEQLYFEDSGISSEPKLRNLFSLKSCEKLKIIHLRAYYLSGKSLEDIHLYLPQLKSVSLCMPDITNKTMINLAKLQNLFKLEIRSNITVSGVCEFIKISPNIKTIILNETYLDEKIIEALIERAKNNPKLKYEFTACDRYHENEVVIDDRFPPNLTVKTFIFKIRMENKRNKNRLFLNLIDHRFIKDNRD